MNPVRQTNSAMRQTQSIASNLSNLNLQQSAKRSRKIECETTATEHSNKTEKNNESENQAKPTKRVTYRPVDLNSMNIRKLNQPTFVTYTYYFRDHKVTPEDYKSASIAAKHHDYTTLNYLDKVYTIKKNKNI